MPEVVADTSPLQYLFQLGHLDLLQRLYGKIWVPTSVVAELEAGIARGVMLPVLSTLSWIKPRQVATRRILVLAPDLGAGEREVLALALELAEPLVILDDSLARRFARRLSLPMTGTLGVLLKAKQVGLIDRILPILDHLRSLNFRMDAAARADVLALAGE